MADSVPWKLHALRAMPWLPVLVRRMGKPRVGLPCCGIGATEEFCRIFHMPITVTWAFDIAPSLEFRSVEKGRYSGGNSHISDRRKLENFETFEYIKVPLCVSRAPRYAIGPECGNILNYKIKDLKPVDWIIGGLAFGPTRF